MKYSDVARIDLVDLDPDMTDLGREFPPLVKLNRDSLADPRVTVYNMDAFNFIKDAVLTYDRVIIDMPDPHNEAIAKLYSVEFYAMIARRMTDDGILISQSSSPYFARSAFWCVGQHARRHLPAVLTGAGHHTVFRRLGFSNGQASGRGDWIHP